MSRKDHPPEAERDWPGHTPEFIARVDATARVLSPAWTPEKRRRRFIWRQAYYIECQIMGICERDATRRYIRDMDDIERLSDEQADAAMRLWLEGARFDCVMNHVRKQS